MENPTSCKTELVILSPLRTFSLFHRSSVPMKAGIYPQTIATVIWLPNQNQNHRPTSRMVLRDHLMTKGIKGFPETSVALFGMSEYKDPILLGPHQHRGVDAVRLHWPSESWRSPCHVSEPEAALYVGPVFTSSPQTGPISSKAHRLQTQIFTHAIILNVVQTTDF